MSSISVDVDIDDIISSMSKSNRRNFFIEMKKEGYISELCVITDEGEIKAPNHLERSALLRSIDEFNLALQRLFNNGWRIAKEEEEYIISLSKKFI